jgi:predicted RNA binding protein YcfA (HicA-like mRNA interferase family)
MRLPRVSGDKVVKALKKAGFIEIRCRGSHSYLYHEEKDRLVTVPVHTGRIIALKTLKSILNQAELSIDEFIELL